MGTRRSAYGCRQSCPRPLHPSAHIHLNHPISNHPISNHPISSYLRPQTSLISHPISGSDHRPHPASHPKNLRVQSSEHNPISSLSYPKPQANAAMGGKLYSGGYTKGNFAFVGVTDGPDVNPVPSATL